MFETTGIQIRVFVGSDDTHMPVEQEASREVASSSRPPETKALQQDTKSQLDFFRDNQGHNRLELALGDVRPRAERVIVSKFIGGESNRMSQVAGEETKIHSRFMKEDRYGEAEDLMRRSLEQGEVQGSEVKRLSEVFLTFGKEVAMVDAASIDMSKMGHPLSLENKTVLALPPDRAEDMIRLLLSTPTGVGESSGTFNFKEKSPLDRSTEGFEMTYTYTTSTGKQATAELVFFYTQPPENSPTSKKEQLVKTETRKEESRQEEIAPALSEVAPVPPTVETPLAETITASTPEVAFVPPVAREDEENQTNVVSFNSVQRKASNAFIPESNPQSQNEDDDDEVRAAA